MPIPAILERDAAELRTNIATLRQEGATKHAAAEKLVGELKAKGINITQDAEAFDQVDAAFKLADTDMQTASELEARLHSLLDHAGHEAASRSGGDPDHPDVRRAASLGALVVASESYAKLLKSGALASSDSPIVFDAVPILSKREAQAFLAGRGSAFLADVGDGTPLVPRHDELMPPVAIPKRLPTVLDLITVGSTGRDAVTWTRQTVRTNAAATTAFGTAVPKSRYQYERVTSPVYRKGHHAVVDEGNISDQEEFEGLINDELLTDLRLKVEADIMNAAGGSDWTGVYQAAGIGNVNAALSANPADAMHKAITVVRVALEKEPTAWGISPEDFEVFYLAKGDDGHYLHHRGPAEAQATTIWGKTAMVSTAYATPVVGEWRVGAKLWVREGVSIVVGRIDDQLLEGLFTIRAQTRGAFAVQQPKAFCTVSNFEEQS